MLTADDIQNGTYWHNLTDAEKAARRSRTKKEEVATSETPKAAPKVPQWLQERQENEKVEAARNSRNRTTVALSKEGAARLRGSKETAASHLLSRRSGTHNEDGVEIITTFTQKEAELFYPHALPESKTRLREMFPTITNYVNTEE